MLHCTAPENVSSILEGGLKTGRDLVLGAEAEWALAFYDVNPVYLTEERSDFIGVLTDGPWKDWPVFEVDTHGLRLVADLPSLVDLGAVYSDGMLYVGRRHELDPLLSFSNHDGWVEIEHLLDPDTDVAKVAIRLTGTAACLDDIQPGRLVLRAPAPAVVPTFRP